MNLLSTENISKSYGEKILFKDITFGIGEGERIGVIGVNGTGKSTFLKVLSGFDNPDEGRITTANNMHIEYLPQNPEFDEDSTVIKQIFKGNSPVMKLVMEYEETLEELSINPQEEKLQNKLFSLNQKMDSMNAWQIESDAKAILTRLGISNFNERVGNLSGGQRKRIALAGVLINPSDLIILDEPTNHIDSDTVDWLEEYLNKRKGALLMITHDRYFLDRIANNIIELSDGKLYRYSGNYSVFLEQKALREEQMQSSESKRQNLLRRELEWIKRGAKARTTKQKARIDRFEKLVEDKIEINNDRVEISSASTRLGKKVIELENISKSFGDKKVINNFSYIVLRDDRIGIVGPNGMGKSTLMNIITGDVRADGGRIDIGETVKIGYYTQENREMDENLRVIDYIKEAAEYVKTSNGDRITASQMLEKFLFPPYLQWTPISKLSGGEKRRLFLLRVLMGSPNVLILDEPTNDLDIETLSILEDYLESFSGAVIIVSHDRYFLDRTVDKIFAFEKEGVITQYPGNYTDYKEYEKLRSTEKEEKIEKRAEKKEEVQEKKSKPLKFSYKEQREFEQIDDLIASVEEEISKTGQEINEAGSDFVLLQELVSKEKELETRLEELMDRWMYLNELAEEIEKSKS